MSSVREKVEDFEKALTKFGELAHKVDLTEIERDAAIQRFEFTYEIAWKSLKAVLEANGVTDTTFPRDVIKSGFIGDLIENEKSWLEMMQNRNLTVHTYREELAVTLAEKLSAYHQQFAGLLEKLKTQL